VKGTVVGIGQDAWKAFGSEKPWTEIGKRVYFKRHVADRIENEHEIVDGKPQEYFLMLDENILANIEE